ncbi:hypothetical protein D4764_21G0000420 [Takifugu flavidus]|uniref:Uncharacterized protein n=2 Tax=Takifugu flavidus TaxID=433684 RepID=A0A5C6NCD3_9TELE|nr:hypothetical protein D4764_21G0000420 [Takifugu flavidus]
MAETFNKQHEHYETMVRHIKNVRQIYGCNNNNSLGLAECVKKIREEHEAHYRVSLKLIGYDFSLSVVPLGSAGDNTEEPLPPHLKLAQGEFKDASDSAKATISKGTTIQELTGWLLRSTDQMAKQVTGATANYQEQRRLTDNLEKNIKEVKRARDLSQRYRQRAREVHSEVAEIAKTFQ